MLFYKHNNPPQLIIIMKELDDYKYALDESAIVAITDPKGIIIHANDNFCKISKYSREELIGMDHRIINSGFHPKEFIRDLWATIANGKIWKGELKNKAKDGTVYWVDTTIVPFLNQDNKPYQYVAIRSDITQRKHSEESLLKSLKEVSDYKFALDESSIVAITNQKGIISFVNDNFCKISKYSKEELLGKDHRIINSGFHSKEFIHDLWTTISNGKIWKGELKNRAKDGSYYWVDTTIVPFLNEFGKPFQYVAIRSDITLRKKAEEDLIKYSSALEFKNTQLIDFCNIVSHNLRAPLINISMLVDYIDQSTNEDERQIVHSKIKPVVNHLMEIFNELVESIQIQQETGIIADRNYLDDCVDKVLIGFDAQIKEYEANIELNTDDAPIIYFPNKYFESIITNLMSNALKYKSPDRKPSIKIESRKVNDTVLLSICDNGLGIDTDLHRNNLFKIRKTFHKHPDAKGFGLFMTKTQVESMGGKIWVESKPDMGSTFFVQFNNQNI